MIYTTFPLALIVTRPTVDAKTVRRVLRSAIPRQDAKNAIRCDSLRKQAIGGNRL